MTPRHAVTAISARLRRRIGRTRLRWRIVRAIVFLSYLFFRLMPAKLVFAALTLCERVRLPARAALKEGFMPIVARRQLTKPKANLSSSLSRLFLRSNARALYGVGAYRECCEFILAQGLGLSSGGVGDVWARSWFELGQFRQAREAIDSTMPLHILATNENLAQLKGHLELIEGDEVSAVAHLELAVVKAPRLLCPHQNMAARYPALYSPTRLDEISGADGRLFDAYNFVGQRVTHVGEGQLGASLYGAAFAAQRRLGLKTPPLSRKLTSLLAQLGIAFDELRILPVEWYTQIGHQGMLDILFRMREMGWWRGKVIFLIPREIVANDSFQRLFEQYGHVLVPGGNIDVEVARELNSLQRWCGLGFNAFALPAGQVVPWQEAGAQAIVQWEQERRADPVREEYDRIYGANEGLQDSFARMRERLGMKADDWHVCLHIRDASHYGELAGTGQSHRNSAVEDYLDAIRHITSQGGWVIKLGGPRSPVLPKMPRLFDYARSAMKGDILDMQLIRNARFFIGTTSGLTNVAVSLGTPCALVNCITVDAQLWNNRVRFALKRVKLRDGAFLSQRQLTSAPWRWRMFGADLLARQGAVLMDNTADEILEAVKEVEAAAIGQTLNYIRSFPDARVLLDRWRNSLGLPHFYGSARPSLYFLKKDESWLEPAMPSQAVGTISDPLLIWNPFDCRSRLQKRRANGLEQPASLSLRDG
jgi:putative glycosyltransferase (TIGR04372 family)